MTCGIRSLYTGHSRNRPEQQGISLDRMDRISPPVAKAMAGQADIQETGLVGSLEKMGTREHKNELAYFCAPGLPIVPKAQPWDPRAAGFQRSSYPIPYIL